MTLELLRIHMRSSVSLLWSLLWAYVLLLLLPRLRLPPTTTHLRQKRPQHLLQNGFFDGLSRAKQQVPRHPVHLPPDCLHVPRDSISHRCGAGNPFPLTAVALALAAGAAAESPLLPGCDALVARHISLTRPAANDDGTGAVAGRV